jgi:radical SAM protein with 4Fe4S-binding SPASM domain
MIIPTNCQFEITQNCNHKCDYCYNSFRGTPLKDKSNLKAIAKKIAENQIFSVLITGGEPFYVKNQLFDVAEIFAQENVDVSVNTNMTMTDREDLVRLKDAGLKSLLVSVMSYRKDEYERVSGKKDSFNRMLKGITDACDLGIHVAANMVVTQHNKNEVYKTGEFLNKHFGNITFCATPLMITPGKHSNDIAIDKEEYLSVLDKLLLLKEELTIKVDSLCAPIHCIFDNFLKYKQFFNRSCVAGRTTFTVSSNGDIRPCSHSDEVYGNILKTSVDSAIEKMTKWQNNSLIPKECMKCFNSDHCRGGCRVSAKAFSQRLNGKHPYFQSPMDVSTMEYKKQDNNIYKSPKIFSLNTGILKYREERQGFVTVYLNPYSHAILNPFEFNLIKLIYGKKYINYSSFLKKVDIEKKFIDDFIQKIEKKNLLRRLK